MVAREQGVVDVVQVHFELAGTVFGEHGADGQLLVARGRSDRAEHGRVLVQFLHRIDLRLHLAAASQRLSRRLRVACRRALAIDQVELELDGHHGLQAERGEARDDVLEHVPWVTVERRAVVLVHADLHLRDVCAEPRHRHEGAGERQAHAIGVAFVEAEAGRLHGAAEHVEREHRARQQQA